MTRKKKSKPAKAPKASKGRPSRPGRPAGVETDPEANLAAEPAEEVAPDADVAAEADPNSEAPADAALETGADAEPEPDAEPETEADAEPDDAADAEPETEADAEPDADADAEPETEPDADAEPDADGDGETDADGETDGEGAEQTQLEVGQEESHGQLLAILESLLFASDKPLRISQLKKLLGERSSARVKKAVLALQAARLSTGIVVVEVDGGYQLRTNPENARWVRRLEEVKPIRMSRAALEVLAVVAYRQPVTRVEIDQIRGVDSGPVLKQLLLRDLLRIVGRKDDVGKPFLYGSTREFLSFFGLGALSDLPSLRDVAELAKEEAKASKPERAEPEPAEEEEPGEIGAEDIAPDAEDAEELDEGDDEVLDALAEASEAARGADRVKRSLRKMAAVEQEGVAPDSDAGRMFSSLQEVIAVQRKRKAVPRLDPADADAVSDADEDPGAAPSDPEVQERARRSSVAAELAEEARLLDELDDLLDDEAVPAPRMRPPVPRPGADDDDDDNLEDLEDLDEEERDA